jgi:glycosyltransferase involved in cell wall biosynthesis
VRRRRPTARPLLVFAPSASGGGPLRYLEEGLPAIVDAWGGPVVVALPAAGVAALPPLAGRDVDVVSLTPARRGGRAGHVLHAQRQAWRLRRVHRPVVTYCLGNIPYVGPLAPSVTLVQNAARHRDLQRPARELAVYLKMVAVGVGVATLRSRRLIAVSHYTRSLVPTRRGRRRTEVVHHGVQPFSPVPRRPRRNGTLRVTVAGSLYSYKGDELAIEAIARCTRRRWELRFAGPVMEPSYAACLEDLASERGVADRVRWLGPLQHSALLAEVSSADVFLMVSRAEACPNVLLEAAVVRPDRAILGARFPWNREYEDLFDATCPGDALHRLLDEAPLDSSPAVVEKRRAALTAYSWPVTAARTVRVLRSAARIDPGSTAWRDR